MAFSPFAGPLPRFLLLYALLYAAFGMASPYLPSLISARGLSSEQIGLVFALGTLLRLVVGPLASRLADRTQALRAMLATCLAAAAVGALCYLPAAGFAVVLMVSLIHAAALSPVTSLSDALTLTAAKGKHPFEYGWVRGLGSAAFVVGSFMAAALMTPFGTDVALVGQAALLAGAASAVGLLPFLQPAPDRVEKTSMVGLGELARLAVFRRLVVVAALVLGSHALHDTFSVIRWREAGIAPGTISALWSASVAAEVVVFIFVGPKLVHWLRPAGAAMLAAAAGVLRWCVAAQSTDPATLFLIQPLHGLTFALLHLAAMRVIAENAPQALAATAQAVYGTVGIGLATALLTLASGWLYGRLGGQAFWVMAVLSAAALPFAAGLRSRNDAPQGNP